MTAETDLLPLPEWTKRDDLGGLVPSEVRAEMQAYARANVAHATAPLQAEIEALRAEVAEWKRVAAAQAELHGEAEERAERLAELLDQAYGHVPAGALADQIHCALLRFALTIADAAVSNGGAAMSDHHVTDALLRDQEEGK